MTGAEVLPLPERAPEERPVLVLDLGGQYAKLIAGGGREGRVYSELVGHNVTPGQVRARNPHAIVLSGGPASVYADDAPRVDRRIFELGIPTLGICYGMQLMALELGGAVERTGVSEFGKTTMHAEESALLAGTPSEQTVWMSHRDSVTAPPAGARVVAGSPSTPIAAFEELERKLYGVQFHPEVVHTPHGTDVLKNFLYTVAGAPPAWTPAAVIEEQVDRIRAQVGRERVLCALSGGGLPADMRMQLVEPLRLLFKDEVRRVGEELGMPERMVWRQPFPGPGLAIRIIGDVTAERLEILRAADAILQDEIRRAGLYRELWQSFAVLPAIRSVGVQGDERTYAYPIVIRAVTSEDAMTADWARLPYDLLETISSRIINEIPAVNRVALDISSKPPSTIEWE